MTQALIVLCCSGAAILFRSGQPDEVLYVAITALVATLGFLYFALDAILLENVFQFVRSRGLSLTLTRGSCAVGLATVPFDDRPLYHLALRIGIYRIALRRSFTVRWV